MTLTISLFILFIILNILDCITTVKALQKGCVEKNKCIDFLIRKFGPMWVYIKLLFVISVVGFGILILCCTLHTTIAMVTLILCDLFYLYVVVNNIIIVHYRGGDNA